MADVFNRSCLAWYNRATLLANAFDRVMCWRPNPCEFIEFLEAVGSDESERRDESDESDEPVWTGYLLV